MPEDPENTEVPIEPPKGVYVLVWGILVSLVALNIMAARLFSGPFRVLTVAGGASVQAYLIINFFMRLRYEPAVFRLVFRVALATVAILFWLVFSDVAYRF